MNDFLLIEEHEIIKFVSDNTSYNYEFINKFKYDSIIQENILNSYIQRILGKDLFNKILCYINNSELNIEYDNIIVFIKPIILAVSAYNFIEFNNTQQEKRILDFTFYDDIVFNRRILDCKIEEACEELENHLYGKKQYTTNEDM